MKWQSILHYMKYNIIISNFPQLLLTIEDLIELSWGSMSHKVGRYADLWKQKDISHTTNQIPTTYRVFIVL